MRAINRISSRSVQVGRLHSKWGAVWIMAILMLMIYWYMRDPLPLHSRFNEEYNSPFGKYIFIFAQLIWLAFIKGSFKVVFLGKIEDSSRISEIILADNSLRIDSKQNGILRIVRDAEWYEELTDRYGRRGHIMEVAVVSTNGATVTVQATYIRAWRLRRKVIAQLDQTIGVEERELH